MTDQKRAEIRRALDEVNALVPQLAEMSHALTQLVELLGGVPSEEGDDVHASASDTS